MFRFLHAADVHLDSPLCGLERYEGAPVQEVRGATRQALAALADCAVKEKVAFVLIAGDLYDGDWRDYGTGLVFVREMVRLREADIPVFVIAGNHDAQSQITKALRLPENVRLFPAEEPRTVVDEDRGIAVHGQSFATRAVTEDLSVRYPDPVSGLFNVGLLHTSADGREGHEPYAPSRPGALALKGYDYWALGHVHKREILHRDPWVVFCGNLQGRHIRETGPKGCTIVTVDSGKVRRVDHRALDVLRWAVCEVDATGAEDVGAVLERVGTALKADAEAADGRILGVRVRLRGACTAHRLLVADPERWRSEVRAVAADVGRGTIWVEKVAIETSPVWDAKELADREDAFGGLVRASLDMGHDSEVLTAFASEVAELRRKLPGGVFGSGDGPEIGSPDWVRDALPSMADILLARLLDAADGKAASS